MNWNELYKKNKYRKNREIDELKNDIILKARVINFIKRHSKLLPIILTIILVLLIVAFHSKINALGLTFLMYILILFLIVYFNTFTIECNKDNLIVKKNMENIQIEYSNLKNVYIEKRKNRFFIKKREYFVLVILYKTYMGNISNIDLPTMFLKENDVQKFLDAFIVKEQSNNNVGKAQEYNLKRLLIKMIIFIIVWTVIILSLFLH